MPQLETVGLCVTIDMALASWGVVVWFPFFFFFTAPNIASPKCSALGYQQLFVLFLLWVWRFASPLIKVKNGSPLDDFSFRLTGRVVFTFQRRRHILWECISLRMLGWCVCWKENVTFQCEVVLQKLTRVQGWSFKYSKWSSDRVCDLTKCINRAHLFNWSLPRYTTLTKQQFKHHIHKNQKAIPTEKLLNAQPEPTCHAVVGH